MAATPYITLDDIKTRDSERDLINVTDPTGTAIDADVVDSAIASAQAEVDSYIGGRVRLPLAAGEISPQVKHYALLVARYYLYADKKSQAVIDEYGNAIGWLKDVARGLAHTGVVQAALDDDTALGSTIYAPRAKPVFNAAFEALYDVPMGPNGSGDYGGGGRLS